MSASKGIHAFLKAAALGAAIASPELFGQAASQSSLFDMELDGKASLLASKLSYAAGKGSVKLSPSKRLDGRDSIEFCGTANDSVAHGQVDKFSLVPGRSYRLSYWVAKDNGSIELSVLVKYSASNSPAASEYIVFAVDKKKLAEADGKWLQFGQNDSSTCMFFKPAKDGERRQYDSWRGGKFSFPRERFGNAPVSCDLLVSASGLGCLWLNGLKLEEEPPVEAQAQAGAKPGFAKNGLKEAEAEEAKRLMADTISKSDDAKKDKARSSVKVALKERLPLPAEYELSKEAFPPSSRNVKAEGANFTREGKPVFLLGSEELSPAMCRMLGMDFAVQSSFMAAPGAKEGPAGDLEVGFGDYPFLETEIADYLRSGTLVYIDMLQGYKVWQAKALLEKRPDLFTSNEAFFAWRPEADNGLGQRIRYNNWASVLERTRKYPIFIYELFNEIAYMDFSPANAECFREAMRRKYSSIERANAAWGTGYLSFYEVQPADEKDNPLSPSGRKHPQLRTDWLVFIESRFGDIMKESSEWVAKQDARPLRAIQSYCGLPFDYQNNHTNPELKAKAEDVYCCEHGSVYYPQWEGAVNEEEILSSMRFELFLDYISFAANGKPAIDGESPLTSGVKSASPETTLLDLRGKWKFKPSAVDANARYEGLDTSGDMSSDAGAKGGWFKKNADDSSWTEIETPGMWGNQGFANCYMGWYRKTFDTPAPQAKAFLCGKELADRANIYLNGELVFSTKNWNEQFSVDLTGKLSKGPNVLAIQIYNRYFNQGFYWGGIRGPLCISKVPFERIPVSRAQAQSYLWQRASHGLGGACVSYFYMNEANENSCALMNPRMVSPEAIPALAEAKTRINSIGSLILKRRRDAPVALLYSLNSFRSSMQKVPGSLSSDRTADFMRAYGALTFAGAPFSTIGDSAMESRLPSSLKALFISNAERASDAALKSLESFVKGGGILVVDGVSLSQNDFDGTPLDASSLLGAARNPNGGKAPAIRFGGLGIEGSFAGAASESRDISAWKLGLIDAKALASSPDGTTFASLRHLGKGKVYVIGVELESKDLAKVYGAILASNGISPELSVQAAKEGSGSSFVESSARSDGKKDLWLLHNWGADGVFSVKPSKAFPNGLYSVRDAVEDIEIKGPSNGKWSAKDLAAGIALALPNEKPVALLIENAGLEKIALGGLSEAQKEAFAKFWSPLWDPPSEPPNGRALWLGKTSRTPALLPSAAAIARACGLGVDILDDAKISQSFGVLRGAKRVQAKLSDYKAVIIPKAHNGAIDEAQAKTLAAYVEAGGGLAMFGTHLYGIHSFNSTWQAKLAEVFGVRISDDAIKDERDCRSGEPRYFNTSDIAPHKVTEGVRVFRSSGCAPLKFEAGKFIPLIKKNASQEVALAARTLGNGRVAAMGDVDWLRLEGLADGDNATLFANILCWLAGCPPISPEQAKKAASPPNGLLEANDLK